MGLCFCPGENLGGEGSSAYYIEYRNTSLSLKKQGNNKWVHQTTTINATLILHYISRQRKISKGRWNPTQQPPPPPPAFLRKDMIDSDDG